MAHRVTNTLAAFVGSTLGHAFGVGLAVAVVKLIAFFNEPVDLLSLVLVTFMILGIGGVVVAILKATYQTWKGQ